MRRRERKCDVAIARITFRRARFARLMGDFVVETSRFAEESAVFEFVIDMQSQADLFLVISDLIRKFSISLIMMLTKPVLSLSLSFVFTGELQDFQKSRHQGSRRVLRQRRCGTFFFPYLLFWIEFTKDSKVTPYSTFINAFSLLFFFLLFYKQSGDTLDKVRGIISEQLGTDLDAVAADSKFVDLGADLLDTVEIMMALEEQFEITLDEEGAEKIGTVQEAADMIQTQIDA